MAFTHTPGHSYKTDVGQIVNQVKAYTGDEEVNIDGSVAGSTTNFEFDVAIKASAVQSILLYSDQALTLKTNSTSSPQETINLKAGIPHMWNTDSYATIMFAGDVTKIYATNSGGTAANFKVRCVQNQ